MNKTISLIIFVSVLCHYARSCNKTNHEANYFCVNCRRTCQTAAKDDKDEPIMGCGCEDGFIMDERTNLCLALSAAPKECNVTTDDFDLGFIFDDNESIANATGTTKTASNTDVTESPLQSTTDVMDTTEELCTEDEDNCVQDEDDDDDGDDSEQSDENDNDSQENDDKDDAKQ